MTKREMQKIDNEMVEKAWEKAQKVWDNASKELYDFERLDYCQAETYQTRGYSFLRSYNTIVALLTTMATCLMFYVLYMVIQQHLQSILASSETSLITCLNIHGGKRNYF